MTIVVPFDDTQLSRAALKRARDLKSALDLNIWAFSVVPKQNREYARERGWLDETEPFDQERIIDRLSVTVDHLAPDAGFEYTFVDRRAAPGAIAAEIRKFAERIEAELVVIGSDNAGHIVTSVSSVGGAVATDPAYDVLLVRRGASG
jgi:nucleotide-binding universal stress UspA family protein